MQRWIDLKITLIRVETTTNHFILTYLFKAMLTFGFLITSVLVVQGISDSQAFLTSESFGQAHTLGLVAMGQVTSDVLECQIAPLTYDDCIGVFHGFAIDPLTLRTYIFA